MICVGIDIAKGKSTVCFLKPGGEVLRMPYDIEHTAEEITKLIQDIRSYDEEVRVVLEATGHYHLPVVTQLLEVIVFVCVANALRMKKFCSQAIRKAKTDKIDAVKIAAFGLTYCPKLQASQAHE
jgi:transposase